MSARHSIGPDYVPARRADVTSVELDGEVVLYADGAIHKLDRIATMLWNAFDGSTTLAELADDLSAVYEVSPDRILGDLLACVDKLADERLLAAT